MNLLLNIVVGVIVALIVKVVLEWLAVPAPLPVLAAALAFLATVFGGPRIDGYPWR